MNELATWVALYELIYRLHNSLNKNYRRKITEQADKRNAQPSFGHGNDEQLPIEPYGSPTTNPLSHQSQDFAAMRPRKTTGKMGDDGL